jgi:hypothetical protein
VCLAVLRPHGQGRHEARQSYGLELPSLEVICPRWRCLPCPKGGSLASSFLKARSIHSLWNQGYIHMYKYNRRLGPR